MDIQFPSENSFSIAEYITKYITKPEKINSDLEFDEKSYQSAFQGVTKFAYACLKSREKSAHEVDDRTLQNNGELWQCSDTFQFLPTIKVQCRTRTVENNRRSELNGLFDNFNQIINIYNYIAQSNYNFKISNIIYRVRFIIHH